MSNKFKCGYVHAALLSVSCTAFDCRTLTNPENGNVDHDGNNIGAIATYSCDENFKLVPEESMIRECMPGDWNGTDPLCRKN